MLVAAFIMHWNDALASFIYLLSVNINDASVSFLQLGQQLFTWSCVTTQASQRLTSQPLIKRHNTKGSFCNSQLRLHTPPHHYDDDDQVGRRDSGDSSPILNSPSSSPFATMSSVQVILIDHHHHQLCHDHDWLSVIRHCPSHFDHQDEQIPWFLNNMS